ncbi:MAG: hypothetical protein N3D11_00830 [Candidatus Sumerlaeia bacterium]|nr:hypothetical protein [Candidatus Sumerlaeia bacterium]
MNTESPAENKAVEETPPKPDGGAKPARRTGKKSSGERKSRRQMREAEVEARLVTELNHLRTTVRHIATHYVELLESKIVQVREAVESSRNSSDRLERLDFMLRSIEGLRVKPDKGRRKDLKQIDELLSQLNEVALKL